MGQIVSEVTAAIKKAASGTQTPSAADYWNALYTAMIGSYPCNTGASTACGPNVRNAQEAMIIQLAVNIANDSSSVAATAKAFEGVWPASSQSALKTTLSNMAQDTGIPGLVQYMASYTNPGATGGALVIATSNVVIAVTDYVYTD
jgi:hypothetical protein